MNRGHKTTQRTVKVTLYILAMNLIYTREPYNVALNLIYTPENLTLCILAMILINARASYTVNTGNELTLNELTLINLRRSYKQGNLYTLEYLTTNMLGCVYVVLPNIHSKQL